MWGKKPKRRKNLYLLSVTDATMLEDGGAQM